MCDTPSNNAFYYYYYFYYLLRAAVLVRVRPCVILCYIKVSRSLCVNICFRRFLFLSLSFILFMLRFFRRYFSNSHNTSRGTLIFFRFLQCVRDSPHSKFPIVESHSQKSPQSGSSSAMWAFTVYEFCSCIALFACVERVCGDLSLWNFIDRKTKPTNK